MDKVEERESHRDSHVLLFSALFLGIAAGLLAASYSLLQRVSLSQTPSHKAESLIASCEDKLQQIQDLVGNLRQ